MKSPNSAAVLGALVADSAALGLHWLYDPQRIAIIEASKGLAFLQPDPAHYEGAKGYFAHGRKMVGESTSYGETCLLMLRHLAKHGRFNRIEYQSEADRRRRLTPPGNPPLPAAAMCAASVEWGSRCTP